MVFRVGMLVVYVGGAPHGGYGDEIFPVEGRVYTIRELLDANGPSLRLVEIVNEPRRYRDGLSEGSFFCKYFRPARLASQSVFDELTAPLKAMKRQPVAAE